MKRFADRVAIVTGAASGIGRATALELAREGATVVVADIDMPGAEAVAAEIRKSGQAMAQRVDVTDAAQARAMAAETVRAFGRIDILVSNAGWDRAGPFIETGEE